MSMLRSERHKLASALLRPLLFFPLFLFSLTLAACSIRSPVVLSGSVIDAYSGQPVEMASVRIGGASTATDDAGTFQTAHWRTSDTLQISAPGYETTRIALREQPQLMQTDAPTVTLTMELRPNTLSGELTDAYTEQPLANVEVAVFTTTTRILTATTDLEGVYAFSEMPQRFTLEIDAPDYDSVEVEINRAITYDVALRPNVLSGSIADRYSGQPIAGAVIGIDGLQTTSAADGAYRLEGVPPDATVIEIMADGYAPQSQQIERTSTLDVLLRPDELTATLVDETTGEIIPNATVIATTELPGADVAHTRIDNQADGAFTLDGLPESGYIQVLAPGYRKAVFELKPGNVPAQIELEPFEARALYVKTSIAAYRPERLQELFDVIDRTELNAMVIDLKSDNLVDLGLIYYQSSVPIIEELGTSEDVYDIRAILAEAEQRGIYTIARIHIFAHDNLLAQTRPDWAAQDMRTGKEFYADWGIAWLDPWNRNVWDYNIQLGIEAAQLGFDEIQFDYIRFPNDASDIEYMQLSQPIDYENPQAMYENITTFMEQAHRAINGAGAFFSVDVFGYAAWEPQPIIGQNLTLMAKHADYICPMVYPSHYGLHELNFENAAAHPYEIVYESMVRGARMVDGDRAKLRPWLQDFTLIWVPDDQIVEYGPTEVRAQIDAAEDFADAFGWSLWSADNLYTYDALKPAE